MLTVDRKNCLPSSEKSAYRGQKNLLTANGKNSLPNDGKIILPRADRIGHVHCKDRGEEEEKDPGIWEELGVPYGTELLHRRGLKPVPTGDGYIPVAKLVQKLKTRGYRGYLAIEHFGAPDQLGFMLRSAEFLNKLLLSGRAAYSRPRP